MEGSRNYLLGTGKALSGRHLHVCGRRPHLFQTFGTSVSLHMFPKLQPP